MRPWGQFVSSDHSVRKVEEYISPANVTFTEEKLKTLYKNRNDLKQMFSTEKDFLNYYNLAK